MPRSKYKFASRAAVEEAYKKVSAELDLYHIAVNALANGKADWKGRYGDYRCQVLGASRADGGCVMITYAPRSQTAYTTCYSPAGVRAWIKGLVAASLEQDQGIRELLRRALEVIAKAQGGAS